MARRGVAGWWLAAPAVAGMGAVVAATGKGLYVSPDAVFYVGVARNLVEGRGLVPPPGLPPVGHFPPLFPAVLAALARFGLDAPDAARVVNVAALGAVVVLIGAVVRSRTRSVRAGLGAAVLAAAAVDLLALSASALSEPLFVVFALGALVALAAHLDGPRTPGSLVAATGLVAAACLTRYAGAALVFAGAAALVRFGRDRRGHGILDAGVFAAVASAPVLGFLAWAGRATGAAGDRRLAWHAFGLDYLGQAARPLARWILPWPRPPAGLALALLLAAAGVVLAQPSPARRPPAGRTRARRPPSAPAASSSVEAQALAAKDRPAPPTGSRPPSRPPPSASRSAPSSLPWLLVAFAGAYLAVVVANRLLTDATGRLDGRFLAPLHAVAILAAVPVLYGRRWTRPAALLAGVLVAAQVAGAVSWTVGGLTDGGIARRGYAAAAWRTSPVVARIAALEPSRPVYSNAVDAIAYLTDRRATPVPAEREYLTGRANPDYGRELLAMRSDLGASGGYLAYFDAATYRRSFLPSRPELERILPLEVVLRDGVGTLYRLANR